MAGRGSKIKTEEGDSGEFIRQINSILDSLIDKHDIGEVVFVQIKNWFDHKWLNFSGKSIVHFETTLHNWGREEALEPAWMKEITLPPFNPNRVLSSKFIRLRDTGNTRVEQAIHGYRRSTETGRNTVKEYTSDGLLLWYSSNTIANQKGSLMVYICQNDQVTSWYARFENVGGWKLTRAKGIDLSESQLLTQRHRSDVD